MGAMSVSHTVAPGNPFSIILAEDDVELRFILHHSLVREGHAVSDISCAGEMREKMAALENTSPPQRGFDVIVSDVQLADGSVMPVFFQHRRLIASFPTVLMTSDRSPEVLTQARQLGITDVLGKPFDLAVLLTTLRRAVGGHRN
jgi:DNA-binding NtrC family response regulator